MADGDTIPFMDKDGQLLKVRLAGIDAPEKLQDFGWRARWQLSELCLQKSMQASVRSIDRYGRIVARIRCNEIDVAALLLEQGLAWHFSRYASTQPRHEAESDKLVQSLAKMGRIGLWSLPEPISPWDWRARHRNLKTKM